MSQIHNLSIAAKATLNLHSLNNEGGEGNQIQTRMVNVADKDGRLHSVNAISGDMLKHIQAEHLYQISRDQQLPLCAACKLFDANRMSADLEFQSWIDKEKPSAVKVVNRLLTCTLDDIEGNLITRGSLSVPRKSIIEFGWAVGIPEHVTTEQYFHVKYNPNRGDGSERKPKRTSKPDRSGKADEEEEKEGSDNLGQAIFHRPANSGQYAIVCSVEAHRIGYNDITQEYVIEANERKARLAALLESLLYTFIQPAGAMRNTQNPHIVDVAGVLTFSTGPAPAPLLSPLNGDFVQQTEEVASALNQIHGDRVQLLPFASLAELAKRVQSLISAVEPYARAA